MNKIIEFGSKVDLDGVRISPDKDYRYNITRDNALHISIGSAKVFKNENGLFEAEIVFNEKVHETERHIYKQFRLIAHFGLNTTSEDYRICTDVELSHLDFKTELEDNSQIGGFK